MNKEWSDHRMLWEVFEREARERPDAPALGSYKLEAMHYRGFFEYFEEMRAALHGLGIGADQRVAVVARDGVQLVALQVVTSQTAPTVLVAETTAPDEFGEQLRRTDCRLVVIGPGMAEHFSRIAIEMGIGVLKLSRRPDDPAGRLRPELSSAIPGRAPAVSPRLPVLDDIMMILTSSGTTGRPKLVPRTHRNEMDKYQLFARWHDLHHDHIGLVSAPAHLIVGAAGPGSLWLRGGFAVYQDGGMEVQQLIDLFEQYRPSFLLASPVIYRALVTAFQQRPDVLENSRLEFVRAASDAVGPELVQALLDVFGADVVTNYGSTEAGIVAMRTSTHSREPASYLGELCYPGVSILDGQGKELPRGEVGEIAVCGDQVMTGYLDDDALNASQFIRGLLKIGDLGYFDERGHLYYAGRSTDLIIRGGFNISPIEIDAALESLPEAVAVASFAVPHPTLGQDIWLAVEEAAGCRVDLAVMQQHLEGRLARTKWPRRVVPVASLPRSQIGKIQRSQVIDTPEVQSLLTQACDGWESPAAAVLSGLWAFIGERQPGAFVGSQSSFVEAGGDSLQAVALDGELRHWFGQSPDLAFLLSPECSAAALARALT